MGKKTKDISKMNNEQYRQQRGTDKPCTALVLPTGNAIVHNRVIDPFEIVFVDDTICPHCRYTDDSKICGNCGREK